MKKIICASAVSALFILACANTTLACGLKFLVMNGGVSKAQCFGMAKPGAILIYRNSNDAATEKALGEDFERTLSAVGHTVRVVDSWEGFESAIKSDAFDMVLSGYSATGEMEKALSDAGKMAKIVPVVDKGNKTEVEAAKKRFGKVIKNSDRTSTKVLTVNEVLVAKEKKKESGI